MGHALSVTSVEQQGKCVQIQIGHQVETVVLEMAFNSEFKAILGHIRLFQKRREGGRD